MRKRHSRYQRWSCGLGVSDTYGTCGAVTGMSLIMGMANSCGDLEAPVSKADTYKKVRELNDSFRKKNGAYNLPGIKRNGYRQGTSFSCPGCIEDAAKILSEKLGE